MKKIAAIVALVIMCAAGCKHKDTPYYSIGPDLKALFNWQPGSYWVMRDSATSVRDSFFVTSFLSGSNQGIGYNNETFDIQITEAALTQPAAPVHWRVTCGHTGNVHQVNVGRYYIANGDTQFNYAPFFDNQPDSTGPVLIGGNSYSHYYFSAGYYNANTTPDSLSVILNKASGFIYVRDIEPGRLRTWLLSSEHITSTP